MRLPRGARTVGPGTIFTQCNGSIRNTDKFDTTGEVFDPKTGQISPIPVPKIPPEQKLTGYGCTVGGDQDNLRVYYVVRTLTPSSGLNPESKSSSVFSFEPFGPTAPRIARLQDTDSSFLIIPTAYGFALQSNSEIAGFDQVTLQSKFVSPILSSCGINFFGFCSARPNGGSSLISLKDGSELAGLQPGSSVPLTFSDGFVVENAGNFRYLDLPSNKFIDFAEAHNAKISVNVWNHVIADWVAGDDNATKIQVRDLSDDKQIFVREGADLAGLHIHQIFLAGKYLYIANESDDPVIDITNSQKVSSGWQVRPVQMVGRDWVGVVKKSNLSELARSSPCGNLDTPGQGTDLCASGFSLVHAPNGNYPGPWF